MPARALEQNPEYPDELARLPHGRHGLPAEFVARNQRERLIASFTQLVAEIGFNDATISATTQGARVSSRTFYKYFKTLEDCYETAFDSAVGRLSEVIEEAFASEAEWPLQVRAALAAALDYIATDPAAGRLLTAEPFAAGSAMAERYKAAIEGAIPLLRAGREMRGNGAEPLPETTERALLGAISGLIARKLSAGSPERLGELLPDLVQFALTPYLGATEARRIAKSA